MSAPHDNNIARGRIERAIMELAPMVDLGSDLSLDDVRSMIRAFMRKHPEIFWFSNQFVYDAAGDMLRLEYNFTREKAYFFKDEIEKVVKYDFQIDHVRFLPESERLVYIYKWIARQTTYNEYSSFNQTIYSVLVNRNSVCTGYAKTAQYLLGLVGIESQLVFGKFLSDTSKDGRHGWNIAKVNGKWYHVDFSLADTHLSHLLNKDESPDERDSILWNYFGVSTRQILSNRTIESVENLPVCDANIPYVPDVRLLCPLEQRICCKSDSGTSSKVFLNSINKNTVIKVLRKGESGLLQNEASILALLSGCQHIIKSHGLADDGLELEQLTSWSELLNSHYYNPTESILKVILRQLVLGLIECRDRGVTYSDIHYNNVFVSKDGVYKWGDFGIAFPIQADGQLPSEMIGPDGKPKGSHWFMAPETYHKKVFTEASAIYSMAMMAYFVMNGMRPPFWTNEESQQKALIDRLKGKEITPPVYFQRYLTLWEIIRESLSYFDKKRPQTYEDFLRQLYGNISSGNKRWLAMDEASPSTVAPVGASPSTAAPLQHKHSVNSDYFASTIGGRWIDHDSCNTDSFAATAILPGNSFPRQSRHPASYQPQKKTPIVRLKPTSGKKKWWNFWKRSDDCDYSYEEVKDYGNEINACVYAPAQIQANKSFIIRVYLYKPEETDMVDSKVKGIDPKAQKKEYKPLDIPVKENDRLTIQLKMSEGIALDTDTKTVIWRNRFTDCSFIAKLTNDEVMDIFGTAYISVNGVPAGEMLFTIDVVESRSRDLYAKVEARRYSKIFISYSHADEQQVRGFAECCRALGTDYFFDRHTLQAGDIFKEKILQYIDNADLFVLCWSKNAAESEWVQIERSHALSLISEGMAKLSIYPLNLKPEAPLPSDMSDRYNFGSL